MINLEHQEFSFLQLIITFKNRQLIFCSFLINLTSILVFINHFLEFLIEYSPFNIVFTINHFYQLIQFLYYFCYLMPTHT